MNLAPNKNTLIFLGLISYSVTFAAPNPPEPIPPPVGLPIDNGVIVLIIASIVYTFFKLRNIKKASN